MRKLRILVLSLLLTSVLVVPIASPAQAACPSVFFMGVHGLLETEDSETVADVAKSFSSRLSSGQTVVEVVKVQHDFMDPIAFLQKLVEGGDQSPIYRGVQSLDDQVSHAIATCSTAKIVLFGFSQGAWIVDRWLLEQDSITLSYVAAAGVLGDPMYKLDGCCVGIARRASDAAHINFPYPPAIPDRFWGNCAGGDPICGGGYANDPVRQANDAVKLASDCTPHCKVYKPGATEPMGEALADQTSRYPTP
jgi:hypothetical protein